MNRRMFSLNFLPAAVFLLCTVAFPAETDPSLIFNGLQQRFERLHDFSCTYEAFASNGVKSQNLVYRYFFKKPKRIRMVVLSEKYRGTILRYDGMVHFKAGSGIASLLPEVTLKADHKWVTDLRGNGLPQSDWGYYISEHLKKISLFSAKSLGTDTIAGRRCSSYILISNSPEQTRGLESEELWIDPSDSLIIKFVQFDRKGIIIQSGIFREIQVDVNLPDSLFQ